MTLPRRKMAGGSQRSASRRNKCLSRNPRSFQRGCSLARKVEDVLIQERVSNLHGGVHCHAIPFGLKQVPGQIDACGNPDAPVQRVPPPGAVYVELQLGPRIGLLEHFSHRLRVEAELRECEHPVRIDPGVGSADRLLRAASHFRWELRNPVQPEIGAAHEVAQPQSGQEVEEIQSLGSLVPGISDKPLVSPFPGENDLLAAVMDSLWPAATKPRMTYRSPEFRQPGSAEDKFPRRRSCGIPARSAAWRRYAGPRDWQR